MNAIKSTLDLRRTKCPMTFVYTKLELDKIEKGESIKVLISDFTILKDLSTSLKEEGFKIINTSEEKDYLVLLIEK